MHLKRTVFVALMMATFATATHAQSGTNSPYSQYGIGSLSDYSNGFSRGMNGLGLGFREHNQVNFQNPASYSALDSLSFIFDAGVSLHITNMQEGNAKKNAQNATFEYVSAGFRLLPHVGVSFGLMPYSNIGFSYSNSNYIDQSKTTKCTNTYSGSGGLHQIYVGAGWQPFKGFSIGANISYLWGELIRSATESYSDSHINTLSKYYSTNVYNYKLDLGAQYSFNISKKDNITLGATYSPGHNLKANAKCNVITTNSQTAVADTTTLVAKNAYELPTSIGVGFAWVHNNKWKIGADYSLQQWSKASAAHYNKTTNKYEATKDMYNDRQKFTVGGEYCNNEDGRGFFQRIRYRFGASYTTPYLKINGVDGPKEYSVSAGFGIPIVNSYNNRSILNISAQWVRLDAANLIKENTFRITVGLTFNERWFAKWKLE